MLVIYITISFFIAWLFDMHDSQIFFYTVIIQAFTSLFIFFRSLITANQLFTTDAWLSVLDKSLMILICGLFLYTSLMRNFNLILFLQIQIACVTFAILISLIILLRNKLLTSAGGTKKLNEVIVSVIPFALIILFMSTHYRLDGFLLERMHTRGAYEAGIYAAAYRLLDAANIAGYLVASFLVPFVARNKDQKQIIQVAVLNSRHFLISLAVLIVSFAVLFAPWIQEVLYYSEDPYHSTILQYCLLSLPGYFFVHVYGSMLTATGRLKEFITILIWSVVINSALNVFLIPSYGALGCCIAAIVSQVFCGIATYIKATKSSGISYGLKTLLFYLAWAVLCITVFYLMKVTIQNVSVILALVTSFIFTAAILGRNVIKHLISTR